MEAEAAAGGAWRAVGASVRRLNLDGSADLFPGLPYLPGSGGQVAL